jgi:methanethiol oxidase
MASSAS